MLEEPRTGHFQGLVGFEAKDFKMCPRGQGRPQGRACKRGVQGVHRTQAARPGPRGAGLKGPGRVQLSVLSFGIAP